MKITDVKVMIVAKRMVLVQVYTDEGLVGIGECSPMNPYLIGTTICRTLKPMIVGMNPFDIEKIWEKMFIGTYKLRGRLHSIAISGIEISLWDIIGKAVEQPIYKLLGGKYRDKVPMYASFMRRDQSPREVAERAVHFVDKGFKAIKIKIGNRWGFDSLPDRAIETVKQVRSAIGDDIALMVDCNSAYSAPRAIQIGRQLEKYNIFHFEEPVPEYDIDSLAKVTSALDVPVAGGEQNHTRYEFKELLMKDAVDIVQPDVTKAGGLLECKKIAAMADAFGKICTPHNTQPTLGTAATLHFVISTPNCRYYQEYNIEPHPLREKFLREPLQIKEGYLFPPDKPGLGVEIDEGFLKEHGVPVA